MKDTVAESHIFLIWLNDTPDEQGRRPNFNIEVSASFDDVSRAMSEGLTIEGEILQTHRDGNARAIHARRRAAIQGQYILRLAVPVYNLVEGDRQIELDANGKRLS